MSNDHSNELRARWKVFLEKHLADNQRDIINHAGCDDVQWDADKKRYFLVNYKKSERMETYTLQMLNACLRKMRDEHR